MTEDRQPPSALLAARRALDGLRGVALLRDWQWNPRGHQWVLHCRLTADVQPNGPVPASTDWYILVADSYPWGSIKFYPAKEGSLGATFPHQNYNAPGDDPNPWRWGDPCLSTSVRVLGRHGYDIEPFDVHRRLAWHFERALEWLSAASRGELVRPGDPFELPALPRLSGETQTVAFAEGRDTFATWQEINHRVGLVEFTSGPAQVLAVARFQSLKGQDLLIPSWGEALRTEEANPIRGIWLRLNSVPVLPPWQAPSTWGELRQACRLQRVDLHDLLKRAAKRIRDGRRHLALIGFPIPERVGEEASCLYWWAIDLPVLSHGRHTVPGFRPNQAGLWMRDCQELFRATTPIDWWVSENWHLEQITRRGKMSDTLTTKRILILGAGALGSALAELLARAGVTGLLIMDGERLEIGNLVRHTLGLEERGQLKAAAVADRLNRIAPHTSAQAIAAEFPPQQETDRNRVMGCEIILDCTASDAVLHDLAQFPWEQERLFVSVSLGLRARRLFCFSTRGRCFPHATFQELVGPWLEREQQEYAGEEFPREGIGCWHPVFPARADDIWLMASAAVKQIEAIAEGLSDRPSLVLFEQYGDADGFGGLRRIDPEQKRG